MQLSPHFFRVARFLLLMWLGVEGMTPAGILLAEEARLTIAQAVWTNGIATRDHKVVYAATAPAAPLYLWMRVQGSTWAWDELQKAGKLPIYHKWFRHSIMEISPEGVTAMIDSINIPVGSRDLLSELRQEIGTRGFFDYRTWSMKENIRPGKWVVEVEYADGKPVLCDDGHVCRYEIEVR